MSENTQLGKSLFDLSAVRLSEPLVLVLMKIADFAASAIPGADGAGLALVESHRPDTVVASASFVRNVDEVQYRLDEGPCLQACEERQTQHSSVLSAERRWPHFGPEAARLGVESALSLPLVADDKLVGSLNVYGRSRDAFDPDAVRTGELFAEPASVSAANALLLVETQRRTEGILKNQAKHATIDNAVGIVMGHTGQNQTQALETLTALSNANNTDVVTMAQQLVDDPTAQIPAEGADPD